jgi:hypothetical protein
MSTKATYRLLYIRLLQIASRSPAVAQRSRSIVSLRAGRELAIEFGKQVHCGVRKGCAPAVVSAGYALDHSVDAPSHEVPPLLLERDPRTSSLFAFCESLRLRSLFNDACFNQIRQGSWRRL